jgi:putative membrane-bound dehydrogenase-like protein
MRPAPIENSPPSKGGARGGTPGRCDFRGVASQYNLSIVNPSPVPSLRGRGGLQLLVLFIVSHAYLSRAAEPRLLIDQPGFGLELIAKEPDIVTPIGMAFDTKGRLLVVESHTHQRPDDYQGPKGDRIRMFTDTDRDGRLDTWTTFAEGYQQAMNLCVRPDGAVYLVTRRDVRILEDTNDDGVSDKETIILHLETTGEYPHNGMSGIVFIPPLDAKFPKSSSIALGIGENSGIPYTLVASDGTKFESRDGAGNVFVCNKDGSGLEREATGFWNPFGLCLAGNALFCVDNDPDASPPCRLVDVIPGGDYGFRYQYGRAGVHPLEAWNGELPGTLPPICGVGEAPTALIPHLGSLWVTSWGDHRIERYGLTPQGGTFSAKRSVVVQGDADFRPTGCAVAPDGSMYFGDWVERSYPVHGKGRIWRLSLTESAAEATPWPTRQLPSNESEFWESNDAIIRQIGIAKVSPFVTISPFDESWSILVANARLSLLQAKRWTNVESDERARMLSKAINDEDADVRLYAVRWIADEKIPGFRDDVAKLLDGDIPTERYFLAVLAAVDWLDEKPIAKNGAISDELLVRELENENRSPHLHALALRLISPNHEWLTIDRLRRYLAAGSPELQLEAVRTLALQNKPERFDVLAEVAADPKRDPQLRAAAVAGLAAGVNDQEPLLAKLADGDELTVAREAARVLRLNRKRVAAVEEHPAATDLDAWNALLAEGGDAEAGRRLFYTAAGPQCANCHQHGGRGGRVGPDLTRLGQQQNRERIIASILQPSREIAPEFQAWNLVTNDGLTHAGLRLPKGGDDGVEPYADEQGREFKLKS